MRMRVLFLTSWAQWLLLIPGLVPRCLLKLAPQFPCFVLASLRFLRLQEVLTRRYGSRSLILFPSCRTKWWFVCLMLPVLFQEVFCCCRLLESVWCGESCSVHMKLKQCGFKPVVSLHAGLKQRMEWMCFPLTHLSGPRPGHLGSDSRASGRGVGHEGGVLRNGLSPLDRGPRELSCSLSNCHVSMLMRRPLSAVHRGTLTTTPLGRTQSASWTGSGRLLLFVNSLGCGVLLQHLEQTERVHLFAFSFCFLWN